MKLIFLFFIIFATSASASSKINIDIEVKDSNELPICSGNEEIILGTNYRIKKTNYYCEKELLQSEWIKFDSSNFKIEKYISSKRRSGSRIIIVEENGDYLISITEKKGAKPQEGKIKWKKNIIHGKQIVDYLIVNWSKLRASETIEFEFLATLQMRLVSFEAYISKSEGKSHWVSIRPSSFVIRMLVPSIRFRFEEGKYPMLKQFSGPFLIEDGKHEGEDVDFYYSLAK